MQGTRAELTESLRAVTIPLVAPSGTVGTGFFVAPGIVITCAHVITERETRRIADVVRSVATDHLPAIELRVLSESYHANEPDSRDLVLLQAAEDITAAHAVLHPAANPEDSLWAFG